MWQHVLTIFIASALINNFVFSRYLGLCIFFGVTKKMETSIGMSFTFTTVMLISASLNWLIYNYVMVPYHLGFLKIVIFIGVIAAFVQAADTIMKKVAPALYYKLGIYLALIVTNCVILAVPLLNADENYSLFESMAMAVGSGLGFSLALIIMASIREKLELADVPRSFQGLPISFVLTGLIALAFLGFSGMITL
ncbi:MAG TPA: Rnf-Nqr domain containing protein [Nitrospirota bacterium]|nr:Rnf-Nqr domain containing protein [Nitrospirota bacterium]